MKVAGVSAENTVPSHDNAWYDARMPLAPTVYQSVAWHHAGFDVPADWEVTAYAIEPRQGRLEFSTRRGVEATYSWEPCRRAPSPVSIMNDFLARIAAPDATTRAEVTIEDCGLFSLGLAGEERPLQALLYRPTEAKLLRWVFDRRWHADMHTLRRILGSLRANDGAIRTYRLAGLDLRLPAGFEIESMAVYPANVMILFERADRVRVTARRWGLPEVILAGRPLTDFYRGFLAAQGCQVEAIEAAPLGPWEGARARYRQRGEHQLDRFMGRAWRDGLAWLWWQRAERRLYAFETIGPPGRPLPERAAVMGPPAGWPSGGELT